MSETNISLDGGAIRELVQAIRPLSDPIAHQLGQSGADFFGVLGGDWLSEYRDRARLRLASRTKELLEGKNLEEKAEPSPALVAQVFTAAADQNDDDIHELWARLLANAMDPNTAHHVRPSFVEIVKNFDPLDAKVWDMLILKHGKIKIPTLERGHPSSFRPSADENGQYTSTAETTAIAEGLKLHCEKLLLNTTAEAVTVSIDRLKDFNLIRTASRQFDRTVYPNGIWVKYHSGSVTATPLGAELIRALKVTGPD